MSAVIFVNRFYAPDHSATAQILTDLAEHLAANGHTVKIVTSRANYGESDGLLPKREMINGVDIHRVLTPRRRRGLIGRLLAYAFFYCGATLAVWRLANARTVIVAKTDPPMIGAVLLGAAGARGATLVQWVQDLYPEIAAAMGFGFAKGPLGWAIRKIRDFSFRRSALVVAIGERMADRVASSGMAPARIAIVPNWSDDASIVPSSQFGTKLRAAWDIPAGAFVLEYSGNLGRAHEVDTLVATAEQLRDRSDIFFLFVGGGHLVDALKTKVSARGLTQFRFAPYQPRDQLSESLSVGNAHWLSLLPDFEGLIVPSKVFGICAAARPVIAVCDPEGEVPKMLGPDRACLCVAPGDARALAAAIVSLRGDPGRAAALGAAARGILDSNYRKNIALHRWRKLIEGLFNDHR